MRDPTKLRTSTLLKTPLNELKLSLMPGHQKKWNQLLLRLKHFHPNWRPAIWFSDGWYSPDGIGGFAIPVSLGHPKLMKLEKDFLGFCEGFSPTEFSKLCCHETGHALDNAFNLRLNKRRQKLFGKTSQCYPRFYTPDIQKNDTIKFLGDYYAQSHPDEDWAETIGYLLYYGNKKTRHLSAKVKQKLILVEEVLKNLKTKKPKRVKKQDLKALYLPTITFEEYLLEKRKNLKLDRASFYTSILKEVVDPKLFQIDHHIMTKKIIDITQDNPWVINMCWKELKKGCQQLNIPLKYKYKKTNDVLVHMIIDNLHQFKKAGMTKVYM